MKYIVSEIDWDTTSVDDDLNLHLPKELVLTGNELKDYFFDFDEDPYFPIERYLEDVYDCTVSGFLFNEKED